MLNHITIMGRLVRDPEYRVASTGDSVVNFDVAVERDYKTGNEKKTDFIKCTAWKKTAEFVTKYFTKGQMIVVSGRLEFDEWADKEGNKRITAKINAANCYFGGGKKESDGGAVPVSVDPASDYAPLDDDGQLPF